MPTLLIDPTEPKVVQPVTVAITRNTRSLDMRYGRLMAVRWLRQETNMDFVRALNAHRDIMANERWTYPKIKGDPDNCILPRGQRTSFLLPGSAGKIRLLLSPRMMRR